MSSCFLFFFFQSLVFYDFLMFFFFSLFSCSVVFFVLFRLLFLFYSSVFPFLLSLLLSSPSSFSLSHDDIFVSSCLFRFASPISSFPLGRLICVLSWIFYYLCCRRIILCFIFLFVSKIHILTPLNLRALLVCLLPWPCLPCLRVSPLPSCRL